MLEQLRGSLNRTLAALRGRRARILLALITAVAMAGPQGITAPISATASSHHTRHAKHSHSRPAHGKRTVGRAPASATSYYMRTIDRRQVWRMGCSFGSEVRRGSNPQDALVVLDFGSPVHRGRAYGARLFGSGYVTTAEVRDAGIRFAIGYWHCAPHRSNAMLRVALGTTNYGRQVTYRHGQAWATMVNQANELLARLGYGARIDVAGANDIEPGWSGPRAAKAWVHGYDSVNEWPYYNFGAAVGCPPYGNCAGAWTVEDVWYVSWGASPALPLPEIYTGNGANAKQWFHLSLYSAVRHKSRMHIAGVLSQHTACRQSPDPCRGMNNTPPRAWTQLSRLLNSDHRTAQRVRWSTDISWTRPHAHHRHRSHRHNGKKIRHHKKKARHHIKKKIRHHKRARHHLKKKIRHHKRARHHLKKKARQRKRTHDHRKRARHHAKGRRRPNRHPGASHPLAAEPSRVELQTVASLRARQQLSDPTAAPGLLLPPIADQSDAGAINVVPVYRIQGGRRI